MNENASRSNYTLILASASPRRRELLAQIGLTPVILPSDAGEELSESDPRSAVHELSLRKARNVADRLPLLLKEAAIPGTGHASGAEDAAPTSPLLAPSRTGHSSGRYIVLGADTIVVLEQEILGKPHSHEEAARMLSRLQGRTHHVYTGVTLIDCDLSLRDAAVSSADTAATQNAALPGDSPERTLSFTEKTAVTFAPMTQEEIRLYAESDEPMDKAGAYGIQGPFIRHISRIEGDYTNVVGLPVHRVYEALKSLLVTR